ncbi:NUDIX hydrolase [Skermania sp. ID1734]|uniref:NUDIX domain-containing protein n=1 Tax=Skermania sp. ID1734 TaxID=2597516 RepID=UPI00117DFB4A|nr:NUDIX hydrolase [Skermania sp. ID1734]TSE01391.1 NUDIX hydrolase [Skermania sp. ID1734]
MSQPRHNFETVSSKTVYEGAILALRLDQVAMPGGRVAEREVVEHHGAVAVVAVDANDKLVLIDQYRHPVGRRLIELPAGLLDKVDEDPLEAAKRELAEETGMGARDWSVLVDVVLSPGFTDEALRVYLAQDLFEATRDEPELEEADIELVRISVPDAIGAALRGEIVNATAVSGILALAAARASGFHLRPPDADWPGKPTKFARRKAEGGTAKG